MHNTQPDGSCHIEGQELCSIGARNWAAACDGAMRLEGSDQSGALTWRVLRATQHAAAIGQPERECIGAWESNDGAERSHDRYRSGGDGINPREVGARISLDDHVSDPVRTCERDVDRQFSALAVSMVSLDAPDATGRWLRDPRMTAARVGLPARSPPTQLPSGSACSPEGPPARHSAPRPRARPARRRCWAAAVRWSSRR